MNILVLSDSHGNLSNMEEAVERERPQLILHLGDCWRDAERLAERYPEEPAEKLLFLGDCRVLICHGHTYGVKTSLLAAGLKAEQDQLDAFLFGHTHKPLIDRRGKTLFLNPGSVGKGLRPTYAVLTAEGGKLDGRTAFLD